jgi:hypothetical protein
MASNIDYEDINLTMGLGRVREVNGRLVRRDYRLYFLKCSLNVSFFRIVDKSEAEFILRLGMTAYSSINELIQKSLVPLL